MTTSLVSARPIQFGNEPCTIVIIKVSDSTYLEVNPAFCRRTGYARDEVIGKTSLEMKLYKHDLDRERMLKALGKDGMVDGMEFEFLAKDGHLLENLISIAPISYKGEECLLAMTVDITQQKAAERALRRSEQKYRNVMMHMEEGYWETDLKGNFTFVNEAESRIHRCSAAELIGMNNRDYTSSKTTKKTGKVFKNIFQTGKSAMISEYEIIRSDGTKLSKTLPQVPHDQEKIRRMIVNLIENAAQVVQARIEAKRKNMAPYQPQILLTARQEADMVVIEVRDNGVGMDKETQSSAFETLFTTRARGTGIGLANVKKIVLEHNGKVELTSKLEEGTTVTIKLPCNNGTKK